MFRSKCDCGEYVLKGQVCSRGNSHESTLTLGKLFLIVIILAIAGGLAYWYAKDSKARTEWSREFARRGTLLQEWAKERVLTQDELDWADMKW